MSDNREFTQDNNIENTAKAYFEQKTPFKLPIFDDFGLDEQDKYYYDLSPLSKGEQKARQANIERITNEFVSFMSVYAKARMMYMACPITSGIYASEWIAKRNEAKNFDPLYTITTTHKLSRHMGGLMNTEVTEPNVRDNLLRGAIAYDNNPDLHPVMPVVREMVVKYMTDNPDYSGGQKYEDVDFMALWYMVIDACDSLVMDGPLTFSRSTDKEINRALMIQAGLHPARPDADMDITDINGTQKDTLEIYKKMVETMRYQVGVGIHPKESLTVILRLHDIFDHLQGKENKISAAREAAGMSKFPENIHPAMQKWVANDAAEFEAMRAQTDEFVKQYAIASLSDTELSQMDDKYLQWKKDGYGQSPAYSDGMPPNLRQKLEVCLTNTQEIEKFFDHVFPHKDSRDGHLLSLKRDDIIELVQEGVDDFARITPRNNGHWNPTLNEIREIYNSVNTKLETLKKASPSNHERLAEIAQNIKEDVHTVKNTITKTLKDTSVSELRAEAREIAKRNLDLVEEVKAKPVSPEAQVAMRKYNSAFKPFAAENESTTFNDHVFDDLNAREQAALPPMFGAREIAYPAKNNPYTAYITIDPKAFGLSGKDIGQQGVQNVKNIKGHFGEASKEQTAEAMEYCRKAEAYLEKIRPGKIVHSTRGDLQAYSTFDANVNAVARKTTGSPKWSSAAKWLYETKFTQMRDDEIFFAPGWERSEHEVQKRLKATEIQLGWWKRDHDTNLNIYTLPADLDKAPANPEPDSLYETITTLAAFVEEEFESGRKVPAKTVLSLVRLCEIHAMIEAPDLVKRIENKGERFNAHQTQNSLMAYMRDSRKNKLGNMETEGGLYKELCDPETGLLFEREIIENVPSSALKDPALGTNYLEGQKNAGGKTARLKAQQPSDDTLHLDIGSNG
ncbi:MAG: hypothetical protein ACLFR0_04260 [Alphaproteobacteria bacterium]